MRKVLTELKIALFRRGLSQAALARALGVHPSRVSRLIQGRVPARARERRLIAEALGVPQGQLFPGCGRRKDSEGE